MIKILEGPLREVEKLANTMEEDGWAPLGPAQFLGVHPSTNARLVMLTMVKRMEVPVPDGKDWTQFAYELNSAGCCDE